MFSSSGNLPKTPEFVKATEQTAKTLKEPVGQVNNVVKRVKQIFLKTIEYVQDESVRVKNIVETKGAKVTDSSDPYLKMTLAPGRIATKIEEGKTLAGKILSDVINTAKDLNIESPTLRKEVNDYLVFRHAPERNAAIAEGAAGVTTEAAKAGLKAIEDSPRFGYVKAIADKISDLNTKTLDMLLDSGVISKDLHDSLRAKYKYHVPLQRVFDETEDVGTVLSGRGYDVRGTGIKKAVGSEREVNDILENVMLNYEQAVIRSEKNIVDNATLRFVRDNKSIFGNLFEEVHPKAVGKTFDGAPILEHTTDPSILQMYENGKKVWIKINDPALATAFRGIGREKLGGLLNAIGSFTRLYAGLATRFNPEFALPNKLRDLQETAVYLASQKTGFKGAAKTVARDPASVKGVLDYLRGAETEGAKLYAEMKSLGGTTGGFGLSTKKQVAMNLSKMEALANSKTKRIANNLVEYVDNWNTIFEDSTRLSVYKTALDKGLSKERAAFLAKEASINFNRMGKGGPVINALWMFSNVSIQGSTKMIRSLKNPKVLGATVLTVGGAVAATNEWNDKVDPDWREKVSKWDRLNGLNIMLPSQDGGANYFTIPVSWGIKPIKVMSDYAYDAVSGKELNVRDMMNDTGVAMLEAYNPVGGSDIVSALSPTFIDTPVEIARNQSWTGNKIKPDFDPNAPQDIRYFDSLRETKTGQTAISISELLQKNASIAISPADMKYAYEQYVGGAGRSISKTVNAITGLVSGEPLPPDEYPFVSRFYRQKTAEEVASGLGGSVDELKKALSEQSRARFEVKQEAEQTWENLKKMPKDEAANRFDVLIKENPELAKKIVSISEDEKLGLTYDERLMQDLHVENGERARYITNIINKMPKENRADYFDVLVRKKIISKTVAEQIAELLKK